MLILETAISKPEGLPDPCTCESVLAGMYVRAELLDSSARSTATLIMNEVTIVHLYDYSM